MKRNKGITLIALIITIIILLILAGITLTIVLGDNSLIVKARIAKEKTNSAQEDEKANLQAINNKIDEYSTITNRNNSSISPNYSSKIDIENYSSPTNQYTAPCSGYILIPSIAICNAASFYCYIDDFMVSWISNSCNYWLRETIYLPICSNSTFYYNANGSLLIDSGMYFIPNT